MTGNSFGSRLVLHSFGESHGSALGAVIEGCPAGMVFDEKLLKAELARRRPGQDSLVSARQEQDEPEILSGVFENKTIGTPIAIIIRNHDARSEDYAEIKNKPRAGHADDVWLAKFGHRDHRGGGRSSGRETVSRVIGGAVARMLLKSVAPQTQILGYVSQLGPYNLSPADENTFLASASSADSFNARFPGTQHQDIKNFLEKAKLEGESWGGIAKILIKNPAPSLGQPVFHKLKSDLAAALMSVGAVVGVDLGEGFANLDQAGTKFHASGSSVYGGIRGGLSTGEDICLRVAVKPSSSILDVAKKGRHDPCILIRAIPVLEAMVALVMADHALWQRQDRI